MADKQPATPYRAELTLIVQRAFNSTVQQPQSNTVNSGNVTSAVARVTGDRSAKRQEVLVKHLEKLMIDSAEFDANHAWDIEPWKHALVDQEARLTTLERQLGDREKEVVERERALPRRESELAKREQVLAEREQAAHGLSLLTLCTGPYLAPQLIRWSPIVKNTHIILDETYLTARAGNTCPEDERTVVMATHPLSPDRMYFELTVTKRALAEVVAIGLTKDLPVLQKMPGWPNYESWGYHGDDGGIFHNTGSHKLAYATYSQGDVVGCGIDNQKRMFFTKNGKLLGTPIENISGPLWPVCAMRKNGEIRANFGPNFVYKF